MGSPKLLSDFVYVIVEKSYNDLKVFLVENFPNFHAGWIRFSILKSNPSNL